MKPKAPDDWLLAIESATSRLSVALLRGDGTPIERAADESSGRNTGHHAERILPLIEALFDAAGCDAEAPTALAVSIGPGSFTSLRVGLATAKGLAFATDRPVIPVPTLEALAFGARIAGDERPLAAILDARRGEVYAAIFRPQEGGLHCLQPDGLFSPEELAARLPMGCRLVGEGAHLLASLVPAPDEDPCTRWPRAASVARLARARLSIGDLGAESDLAPRYVRRAEAEAKRTASAVEEPS